MSQEITHAELDLQAVELLPQRAALSGEWTGVWASNLALALNAGTEESEAAAYALQAITIN